MRFSESSAFTQAVPLKSFAPANILIQITSQFLRTKDLHLHRQSIKLAQITELSSRQLGLMVKIATRTLSLYDFTSTLTSTSAPEHIHIALKLAVNNLGEKDVIARGEKGADAKGIASEVEKNRVDLSIATVA